MQHENRPQGEALKQASLGRGAGPLPGASQAAKRQRAQEAIRAAGMLPVLVLLCLGFHFMSDGRFFTGQNLGIVLQQASVNTVLAAGMTFVILTGGIDLSVGSILAASAMAGLIVSLIPEFASLWIVVSVAAGLAFGLINGALIASLRLPPFIVTLGSLTAVRGLARLFGADTTVFNPSIPFAFIGNGSLTIVPGILSIPWLSVVALIVILASWLVLRRTVLGVHITRSAVMRAQRGSRASRCRRCSLSSTGFRACSRALAGPCRRPASMPQTACSLANLMSSTPSRPSSSAARRSSAALARSGGHSSAR